MKTLLILAAILLTCSRLAEGSTPFYKTETFKKQYEARMDQYVTNREKKIGEIKKSFYSEILPAIEVIKPTLEIGRLTKRKEDWPSAFEKHNIKFVRVSDDEIWLYFVKWVSKTEAVVYYFDASKAPTTEATKADGEDEYRQGFFIWRVSCV